MKRPILILTLTLCVQSTLAADPTTTRPNEADMFGAKPHTASRDAFETGEVKDNPLQIGGLYYQRLIVSAQEGRNLGDQPISSPLMFDSFMDSRPNDRLRGFINGRLFYDANRSATGGSLGSFQYSSISTAPSSLTTPAVASNPQVVLDQAWLKFDINRTIFVTAGKQHVRWGAARFWNPTDFFHTQTRDPLLSSDLRLGNSMVKFAIPWEKEKSAFYVLGLFDNPAAASTLGQMGVALRAETVILGAEVGAEWLARGSRTPVVGADLSAPLGPFDIYAETAILSSSPTPFYNVNGSLTPGLDISTIISEVGLQGPIVQTSGGINYQFAWKENRQATIGVEYFYNGLGYSDPKAYPALIFFGAYRPFYTGRHYAAIYLTAEGPDEDRRTNYTVSVLGNLSDASFVGRLDFSWRVLTYLTFEAFAAGHFGTKGGEFRFALNAPAVNYKGTAVGPIDIPAPTLDLGLGLRVSF